MNGFFSKYVTKIINIDNVLVKYINISAHETIDAKYYLDAK